MTTDLENREQGGREARPANRAKGSSWHPDGWPNKPKSLSLRDRPTVAKNLAGKAALIGPTPSVGAKIILDKALSSKGVSGKLIKHRCFDLPYDEKKARPGRKGTKGKSETDTWIAKTSDWHALAQAAFESLHPNETLDGFKWSKFERDIFEGTSLLSNEQTKNISTKSADLVLSLANKLVETAQSTGIEKFWDRLSDTPFDLDFDRIPDESDEEEDIEGTNVPHLSEDQVLSLGLGKLVRCSPLDGNWRIGEVQPQVEPYWAEVSIELGHAAVPNDLRVLEIPPELRSQFNAGERVPLPGFEPGDGEDITRFPAEAQEWLLEKAWNGTLPDDSSDVMDWTYDHGSDWEYKSFFFDCRLMMILNRGADGKAKIQLQVRAAHQLGFCLEGNLYSTLVRKSRVLDQLQDPNAGHKCQRHRINENFYPEIIVGDESPHEPLYWTAYELGWAAQDLDIEYPLDESSLTEALNLLRAHPFLPSIKVAKQMRSGQFPKDTVLGALFANLALGDSPERIDRLLKAQAQAITDFGNNHLDELVYETQSLLDQLD